MKLRINAATAIGLLLALTLTFAAARPGVAADKGPVLRIGISQYPSTLHPNIDSMMVKTYVLGMVLRPVTAYNQDWELVCMLCVELPTLEMGSAVENSTPDGNPGVAVTYRLRSDARWGDGTPVTTKDVAFTLEVGRHPETGVSGQELYRRIYKLDIIDDHTFTIHVDRLTFSYNALALQLLPDHLERPLFEADPKRYRNRTHYDSDPTNPGLYFGPYRIVEVVRGSHIALEPNPTWWGEPPYFGRIEVKAITNTAALEANILSGEIDAIAGESGISLDQAIAFERRHRERFQVIYQPGLVYEHLDVMLDNPLLADRRVRQALLYGVDREAISTQLFGGRQPVAHTSVNPLDWVYSDDVPQYDYNPTRAKALLEEAGWRKRGRYLVNDQGERLSVTLMTTAGNRSRELVQQILQNSWQQLGVEVKINNEAARVFFGQTLDRRRFDGLAMFAWISSPESVPRTTLHSEEIPRPENNWNGQNYPGYSNPEMDRLIDAIEVELDRERRRELWHQLQQIYARDLPALPLFFRANPYVFPKEMAGLRPTGHQYPSTLWVEEWHLKK